MGFSFLRLRGEGSVALHCCCFSHCVCVCVCVSLSLSEDVLISLIFCGCHEHFTSNVDSKPRHRAIMFFLNLFFAAFICTQLCRKLRHVTPPPPPTLPPYPPPPPQHHEVFCIRFVMPAKCQNYTICQRPWQGKYVKPYVKWSHAFSAYDKMPLLSSL